MDVTIRKDATYVYVDVFDAPPSTEVYLNVRSRAVPPNNSTEGVGAGVHRTASATGTCTFRFPVDFMLPDLPREVTVDGLVASETFTS